MVPNLTAVPGVRVGHYTDAEGLTGCTIVLLPPGSIGGVDVRGAAPGTRETDLLRPGYRTREIHAFLLTGGSAFGLEAASGVVAYLEERGIGLDVGVARVPLVPAAVLFDLSLGDPKARPSKEAGYKACLSAAAGEVPEGNVGAGTGATVGKLFGVRQATKGGSGSWALKRDPDLVVGALVAVNAWGDVVDPETKEVIAGPREPKTNSLVRTLDFWSRQLGFEEERQSTTLGVVVTNARLTKEEVNKVAQMAHDGLARVINPVHTLFDGDTVFAAATGKVDADAGLVGALAAEVLSRAVIRAVKAATGAGGVPCARELQAQKGSRFESLA